MRLLIVSTSKIHGSAYMSYLLKEVKDFFKTDEIVFIPYARPSGISYDEYTEAHFNRARALMNLGETDRALESYVRGLSTGAPTSEILIEVAEAHIYAGQEDTARLYLDEASRLDPQSNQVREARGRFGWEESF